MTTTYSITYKNNLIEKKFHDFLDSFCTPLEDFADKSEDILYYIDKYIYSYQHYSIYDYFVDNYYDCDSFTKEEIYEAESELIDRQFSDICDLFNSFSFSVISSPKGWGIELLYKNQHVVFSSYFDKIIEDK